MKTNITLLLMLLIASLRSVAQGGAVSGKVTNDDGKPLLSAVTLVDSGKVKYATLTDGKGIYTFKGVKAGTYDIQASAVGYKTAVVNSVIIRDGLTASADVLLESTTPKTEGITYQLNQPGYKTTMNEKKITGVTTVAAGSTTTLSDASGVTGGKWAAAPSGVYSHYEEADKTMQQPRFYDPSLPEYKRNPENDFMNVKASPVSTMSVDVDRASYCNVRQFLNTGERPPVDAVRVEEMVNYFEYDYPQPTGEDPIAIQTELTDCPWQKDHKILHIGMQAKKVATEHLPPSNLVFLIDVSGSMDSPERLPLIVSAMKLLVTQLRPIDRVAIVSYAGNAGLVLPSTPGYNKRKILEALDRLEAGGSTAGGEGIMLAYKVATANFIKGGNNRVLLATDGDFNVGISADNELEDLIVKERKTGVFLTCLGVGTDNYKDAKMEMLADKGNGNYDYLDNLQEAQKALVSEFGGTLFTVAKDVKAQIEFNPDWVQGYRLIGYEDRVLNTEDFKDDRKDAGDMGSGHTVTIMYEIVPTGVKSNDVRPVNDLKYQPAPLYYKKPLNPELATIKFRYKKPDGEKSTEMVHTIDNTTVAMSKATENSRFSTAVAMFGMILKNSKYKGTAGYEDVIALAEKSKTFDKDGYRAEFIRLVRTARGYKYVTASE